MSKQLSSTQEQNNMISSDDMIIFSKGATGAKAALKAPVVGTATPQIDS